jgi:Arc/MetJ-type ribon-helix-helix transcriptional regulator
MNTKIISISLPEYIVNLLDKEVANGNRSEFVIDAVMDKVISKRLDPETEENPWEALANAPGKRIPSSEVLKLLRQIRDEE